MKTKSIPFELDASKTSVDKGIIAGYASVFGNVDHDNEVVETGAFTDSIKTRGPQSAAPGIKVLWQHNPKDPIGLPTLMQQDSTGLYTVSQLSSSEKVRREYLPLIADGIVNTMSIGYKYVGTPEWKASTGAMHLKAVDLFEYSPVTFPANDLAVVTDVKHRAERAVGVDRLDSPEDAAYAMAVLMGARGAGSFSDLAAKDRHDLYQRISAAYATHGMQPPGFVLCPVYSEVEFKHDEPLVFADRSLAKRAADVTSAARSAAKTGQISGLTQKAIAEALDALNRVSGGGGPSVEDVMRRIRAQRSLAARQT